MNERLRSLAAYPMVQLERRKQELRARGVPIYDFGTGDPREPTPAFVADALRAAVPEVSQYPSVLGSSAQRAACAAYLERRFGVAGVDPEREILPTGGSKEAIFHLPMVCLDPDSERNGVLFAEPAYPVFEIGGLFAGAALETRTLGPADDYLLRPGHFSAEQLDRAAVVFLNYPHNPSGQTMPADLFRDWVAARERHDFLLVSDECYCDLWFEGEPPRSLLEFGREGCLVVHSLSKRSGMTGYRSGFLAGDPEWIAILRRFRAGMGVAAPVWTQAASTAAWSEDEHVAARREIFAAKRRVLLELFARRGLEAYPGTSTLFLWARPPGGVDGAEYAQRLLELGIVVSPGSFFGPGQDHFIRLALVPTLADCEQVASLWPE